MAKYKIPKMRTRRMERYKRLREVGFLKFEAKPLSRVPLKTPYFKGMISERKAELQDARQKKLSRDEFEKTIKARYQGNRWLRRTKSGQIVADPWHYLREYEERWRNKFAQYESPWEGRQRRFRDFIARTEGNLQRRRGYLQAT